jgi:tRNA (guanosine-2'-O-)-methyltransferase
LLIQKDYSHLQEQQKLFLLNQFALLINEQRKNLIERVLNQRTRCITLVLEEIINSQNASAVLRTAEAMGIQDVHLIDQAQKYVLNKGVLKGAYKWLNIYRYQQSSKAVLSNLKFKGYCICALDPSPQSKSIFEIDLSKGKSALVFGNEHFGLSKETKLLADEHVHIPMFGFTESFNLSVSAAMSLQTLIPKLHSTNANWQLTEEEKLELRLDWYRKSIPRGHILEQELISSISKQMLSNKKAQNI